MKKLELSQYGETLDGFHIHINTGGGFSAQECHYHDYFQMYYVLKGQVFHHISGGKHPLVYGDVFIIPPNHPHYVCVRKKDAQFYSCSFSRQFAEPIFSRASIAAGFLSELMTGPKNQVLAKIPIPLSSRMHLRQLLDMMLDEYAAREAYCRDVLLSFLLCVLNIVSRSGAQAYDPGADAVPRFEDEGQSILWCVDYLSRHYTGDITCAQLIRMSRLQRKDFFRLFKSATGRTFHEMRNHLRIGKAAELIRSSAVRPEIGAIARLCGYTDFSTFYRNFVKRLGVSPGEYHRGIHESR